MGLVLNGFWRKKWRHDPEIVIGFINSSKGCSTYLNVLPWHGADSVRNGTASLVSEPARKKDREGGGGGGGDAMFFFFHYFIVELFTEFSSTIFFYLLSGKASVALAEHAVHLLQVN